MIFYFAIPLTLLLYWLTRQLYRLKPLPFINPVLIPMLIIMALISVFGWPLAEYQSGALPIHLLLEPAVVALAIPLYQQASQIKARLKPILICCSISVVISVGITFISCSLLPVPSQIMSSIATRSITTPLAMSVSTSLGGVAAVAAAMVV